MRDILQCHIRQYTVYVLVLLGIIFLINYAMECMFILRFDRSDSLAVINPSIDIDVSMVGRRNDTDLRIFVITYNRPASLLRLLKSLNEADYLNDKVAMEIWIDMSKSGKIPEETYKESIRFNFKKGGVRVVNHTRHVGIYGQWMGLWQPPCDSHEIAIILEDDLTVSPLFYRYLKHVHKKYDKHDKVNGYSLQCVMIHGGGSGNVHASDDNIVFTYPIIGTWGFSPKKTSWINFTKWFNSVYMKKTFQPLVPGIIPTAWYKGLLKTRKAETMWEMWHIFYSWTHKEVTLFPNLPNCESFVINWREIGLHFKKRTKITDHLITKWDDRFEHLPDSPIHISVQGHMMSPYIDMNVRD